MVKNGNAHRSGGGGGGGGGGRSYGLILLLAVGAAILGVMVLHKLREGRLFSLLVKEKDHELLSLHLLLQKEREFNKDAQKKLEEMKTNMYSVTAQKTDVEGRLMEVKSLVSSLKDEQKILESQLEEKRIEIKTLKQQQTMLNEEIGFRDTSNQKQGGNEDDVKSHKDEPASIWSVSSDDPSNPPINITKGETRLAQGSSDDSSLKEHETRKLEDAVENGKPEDGNLIVTGLDGLDSAMRAKNSKQRKMRRRRRYRDLIRRFTEGNKGDLEQNEVAASRKKTNTEPSEKTYRKQDEYVASRKEESLNMAETKERKDDNGTEEYSKEIDRGTDHSEDEEERKSSKYDEHNTN